MPDYTSVLLPILFTLAWLAVAGVLANRSQALDLPDHRLTLHNRMILLVGFLALAMGLAVVAAVWVWWLVRLFRPGLATP